MDINVSSQIVVQTAAQWAADTTVYSEKRILVTSDALYTGTDQRKFKIADGVQKWSDLDYMPIAQTLAEVLANDNDTNNLDIVSPNGKSIVSIRNSDIRLLHDDGNDSELYLHSANATLKTATGGFYVNENTLTDTKFVQIKTASTTIQHDTTVSVNTPSVNLPQETASRVAIIDASRNLKAADTTTYPSLTELTYVKGVTSAIQTQLNGKQATITTGTSSQYLKGDLSLGTYQGYSLNSYLGSVTLAPADATTYYFGGAFTNALTTTAAIRRLYIPKSGTIKAAYVTFSQTAGTAETSTISIRLNNTTDTTITASVVNNAGVTTFNNTGLSIAVVEGDYIEIKWVTPTWATNPTAVICNVLIYIE